MTNKRNSPLRVRMFGAPFGYSLCGIEVIFQREIAIYYKDFEQFLIKHNKLPIVIYFLRNCESPAVWCCWIATKFSQTCQINEDNYSLRAFLLKCVIILIYLDNCLPCMPSYENNIMLCEVFKRVFAEFSERLNHALGFLIAVPWQSNRVIQIWVL